MSLIPTITTSTMSDFIQIFHHYDLSDHNTMALSCSARQAIVLHDKSTLMQLDPKQPYFILSGGSNVLLPPNLDTTVLLPRFMGKQVIQETEDELVLEVAGGENWHELVTFCTQKGWYGLENLALIPGLAGAAPVQNIGAYGVQLEDVIDTVEVFDWQNGSFSWLSKQSCQFRYRHSIFKDQPGRYLICAIRLRLHKNPNQVITGYGDLHHRAQQIAGQGRITPLCVYQAIIEIRSAKLPDPKDLPNCGSFFQNPVITKEPFNQLIHRHPDLPSYPVDDTRVKIPAGWLIEQAGLKGGGIHPILTHKNQALVLTNHARLTASQADIANTQDFIISQVYDKFGVLLVREPVWVHADGSYD